MATTKIGVEVDLDPSGVQRGAAAAAKAVDGIAGNTKGINKLDNAFKDLGQNALNLPGPLGRLSDAFLEFAPGGLAGAAFIGGIGASVMILKSYSDAAKRTEELNKKLAQSIADIEGRSNQFKLSNLTRELDELGRKSESAWLKFWLGADGRLFGFGDSFEDQRIKLETEIRKTAATIVKEVDDARIAAFDAAQDISLARAEARGGGIQERLQQARDAEQRAQTAYSLLLRAGTATEEQLLQAKAKSDSATASRIRAETALRDDAQKRRLSQEEQVRKTQEFYAQQRVDREKYVQNVISDGLKRLDQLGKQIEERRKVVSDMVTADVQKTLSVSLADLTRQLDEMEQAALKAEAIAAQRVSALEPLVSGIASGLDVMTKALVSGENAFKSFGDGARAAITDILRALARQNIVEGLGALGKGFAAAANPLTAFAAGSFFKSAAQHFAAAAAAGVGAAAIGAGGGGSSGVGRGVGPGGAFGFNQSQLGGVAGEQGALYITIQGGGLLDMNNPETAKAFARALQTATNRRIVFSGA